MLVSVAITSDRRPLSPIVSSKNVRPSRPEIFLKELIGGACGSCLEGCLFAYHLLMCR